MRHAPAVLLAALVWALAPAATARAAYIPWKYNWSRNPSIIYSDHSHNSYVTLTDEKLQQAAIGFEIDSTLMEEGQVHETYIHITANMGQQMSVRVVVDVHRQKRLWRLW